MTLAPSDALGVAEIDGFTVAMAAADVMEKAAPVRVLQVELNDRLGVAVKLAGGVADVEAALAAAESVCRQMHGQCATRTISRPSGATPAAALARREFNALIEQDVVHTIEHTDQSEERQMANGNGQAIGLIETQGFAAVIEAADAACKAADVEIVGREKLGGGYITIVIEGDVAAVNAAIETARTAVGDLGKLIAAHVIPRPSASVRKLLAGSAVAK